MNNKVLAYTLFRAFMGLNFFLHGAVRLGPNYGQFIDWVQETFAETWLPEWLVTIEAALIPGVEIVVGALLFLGFKTRLAIVAAMLLMATLVFGMNIVQNWELVNRHVIYMIALYILLHDLEFNEISLDQRRQ